MYGDGMLDQIPSELRDAFVNLMHDRASTYEEMRHACSEQFRPMTAVFFHSMTTMFAG